jgi:hypothetical protein
MSDAAPDRSSSTRVLPFIAKRHAPPPAAPPEDPLVVAERGCREKAVVLARGNPDVVGAYEALITGIFQGLRAAQEAEGDDDDAG